MKTLGKPESSSDVINKEPKVLLIGYGWVGQYMGGYFKNAHYVTGDGIIRSQDGETIIRDTNQIGVKGLHYDLAIIGTPTPMNKETGQCDTSIVENCVDNYKDIVDIFLVKSTVEIGTCERLEKTYGTPVCMSPEYVGETLGHPLLEPRRDAFQIIGGSKDAREKVAEYFMTVLHASAPIHLCSSREAEIIKYCENMWIMRRVDYWNDVFEVCETLDSSFQAVREGIVLDPRMDRTHSFVYRNNPGWSGKCLPKDMNALAYKMRQVGHPMQRLEHSIKENVKRRSAISSTETLIPERPLWEK
jgi:UDPglucose 6-dehydrogenase